MGKTLHRTKILRTAAIAAILSGCGRLDPKAAQETSLEIEWQVRHDQLTEAREAARKGALAWTRHPESEAYSRFRLLEAEALLASGKVAEAMQIVSALKPGGAVLQVRRLVDLGNALLKLERFEEARAALDKGTFQAAAQSFDALLLEGLVFQGTVLVKLGDLDGANEVWRAALVKAAELHDSYYTASIYNNQGKVHLQAAHFDRAIPYFEKALSALEPSDSRRLRSLFLGNLAICLYELGEFDRAFQMQKQAIAVQEQVGASLNLMNTYGETGRLYQGIGEGQKAAVYYARALELAKHLGTPLSAATWAVNLAGAYIQLQDWDNAEKYNHQARTFSAGASDDTGLYIKVNAAGIAAGRGALADAERLYGEAAESPQASPELTWDTLDELAKLRAASGDAVKANRHFERAIKLIADTRADLSRKDERISFLSGPIHVYRDYVEALVNQGDWTKAMLVADSSRAQVLSETNAQGKSASISDFQSAAKNANSVLLFYWLGPRRSFAWVVSKTGSRIVDLPVNEPVLRELVSSYRAEIERAGRDPLANPGSAGWKLYDGLLKPLQAYIPPASEVIVIPDGPLNDLNLETIPIPSDHAHYWIDDVRLSVAPSLSVLTREDAKPDVRRAGLLIIGDPEPVAEFPKLAYAGREIGLMEKRFASRQKTLLTGSDATPEAYLNVHAERFSLIHFAAHAEANRERPLNSAVILSPKGDDYKLYAREISDAATPLRADLVTVSACRSAGAKSYSGEGLIGFAWAFLHAGARHVIAGLWDVDDGATPVLIDRLYAGIESGEAPAAALREAKLGFVHSDGNRRKPYYWGPLQVYRRSAR